MNIGWNLLNIYKTVFVYLSNKSCVYTGQLVFASKTNIILLSGRNLKLVMPYHTRVGSRGVLHAMAIDILSVSWSLSPELIQWERRSADRRVTRWVPGLTHITGLTQCVCWECFTETFRHIPPVAYWVFYL